MNLFIILYSLLLFETYYDNVESRTYLASTSRQLREYLRLVNPGDTIQLRDGYYTGNFVANRIGRANAPIRLVGTQRAVLSNNRGTALYVTGQYWWMRGFTVSNSRRGIAVQNGNNNLLERVNVRDIDEEGIALREDSDANTIRNCVITRTGLRLPQYGFGISIGSDERHNFRGYVDRSDRNSIINNRFQTGSPAEAIHAYEGTCCGIIRENSFDGRPNANNPNSRQSNRCWVSINGNNYRIDSNNGRNSAVDGFRVRMSEGFDDFDGDDRREGQNGDDSGQRPDDSNDSNDRSVSYPADDSQDIEVQGCGNQFRGNRCEFNSNGYCIRVINPNRCRVRVYSDNTVVGNTALSNVAVTNL